jgi:hypothetical protein
MATNLNQNTDCCETSCDNTTVNTPGPQGATGATGSAGTNGSDGVNGYSVVANTTTIPTSGYFNLFVDQTSWLPVTPTLGGFTVFITGAGHFAVSGKGTTHITLNFLDYPGDPGSPGDSISSGAVVAPAGARGADGTAASELSLKGQLLTHTGSALSSFNVGANSQVLKADSTAGTGLVWGAVSSSEISGNIDLASQVTGTLPVTSVGNAGGAVGDLLYWNGSNWVRLPAVAAGQLFVSQGVGAAPAYATQTSLGLATYAAKGKFVSTGAGASDTTTSWGVNIATAEIGATNPVTMDVTFTDPVSVDLPVFAFEDFTPTVAGTAGPELRPCQITNRTTSGLGMATTAGLSLSRTIIFYILNN